MRYCYITFFSIFLLHNTLFSQIEFMNPRIEDEIAFGVNSYAFSFDFKNIGNCNIQITKVATTCSCTISKLAKKNYEPNECGKIYGVLNLNDKVGMQPQEIVVHTNNTSQPHLKLSLEIKILSPVEIKPRLVYWEKDAKLNEKVIAITINDSRWKIESVTCDNAKFVLKNREDDTNKSKHSIVITPISTKKTMRDVIKMELKNDKGASKIFAVHALVK